jgi:hypothetical protein
MGLAAFNSCDLLNDKFSVCSLVSRLGLLVFELTLKARRKGEQYTRKRIAYNFGGVRISRSIASDGVRIITTSMVFIRVESKYLFPTRCPSGIGKFGKC